MNQDFTPGKPIRVYTESELWQDYSTDELVGKKLNVFTNWKCGAGVENLFIDMDGYVWTASCRVGGRLGNVFKTFNIPENWINCTKNTCSCGADLFIPKIKTVDDKKLLRKTFDIISDKSKSSTVENFVALERTHASNRKQIYWEIGRRCNYDCSYCWPWIHNNTDPHKTLDELLFATKNIEDKFMRGETVNFIISGGEPTANKDFLEWVRYLNSKGHHVSLHSNGSRKPEYYSELIKYGDLNLSVHFEFYDREKFVKVVDAVSTEKATKRNIGVGHLEVKIMMAPHNRDEALSLEKQLKTLPYFENWCTLAIVPIRGSLHNKFSKPQFGSGSEVMQGYTKEDYMLFGSR